tara:strand:- start:968 stop:1372 length:405 start_codon:yes stop_codon:yes gene_type:complete
MITECEVKPINILCFEDNEYTRITIEDYMRIKFKANVDFFRNYLGSGPILKTHLIDRYDAVIADCMTPLKDAFSCLSELANCGKTVIFYTCLDREDFCSKCKKILGYIPFNFKFVQKATADNLNTIGKLIENEL